MSYVIPLMWLQLQAILGLTWMKILCMSRLFYRHLKKWEIGRGPRVISVLERFSIIDSDTRVPEDCFADAVSEMTESPEEVAIIQHMSGVMQVANHFFENDVAHFTRGIQHAISHVVPVEKVRIACRNYITC